MFLVCCVGSGLCDGLLTLLVEPMVCVCVCLCLCPIACDLVTLKRGGLGPIWAVATEEKENVIFG